MVLHGNNFNSGNGDVFPDVYDVDLVLDLYLELVLESLPESGRALWILLLTVRQ